MRQINLVKPIVKFQLEKLIINRLDWVKYLVAPDWQWRIIGDIVISGPGMDFQATVDVHVNAYLFDKKEPPAEIATAIMNIADDVLTGREVVLKTGDYLAIQNFIRRKK
jgi:hypothetical protein